jgi:CheY-like chemotaxis protein
MAYTYVLGTKDEACVTLNSEYGKRELPGQMLLACQESRERSNSFPASRVRSSFTQKRVLCVDDDVMELALRGKILELQGYSVVLQSCPLQALRCDLSTFDLAILDFEMPGMNGRELLLRMKALHARFPILLFSASASGLSHEESILFSRCLDKGVPVRHLLEVIASFLDPNEIPDFGA